MDNPFNISCDNIDLDSILLILILKNLFLQKQPYQVYIVNKIL
jgi:hypothetical protein